MIIITGLAIIGIGVFAIAIFIKSYKENEIEEAAFVDAVCKARQLDAKHLDSQWTPVFPTTQNMNLWTPELKAFIRNHGISLENSNDDIYHHSLGYIKMPEYIEMTDPNFGVLEAPYASVDGDRLSEYMVDSFECTGTVEDAEKIGLKLD